MKIILSTSPATPSSQTVATIDAALETGLVSALIAQQGEQTEEQYETLVASLLPITQKHNCALLLDNQPDRVSALGADGVHMRTGQKKFGEALKQLQPDFIVGAGDLNSRHETMLRAEAGADYVMFGDLDRSLTDEDMDLANWCVEMFEVPSALCHPNTPLAELTVIPTEFVVLGDNIWQAAVGPENALKSISIALTEQADAIE